MARDLEAVDDALVNDLLAGRSQYAPTEGTVEQAEVVEADFAAGEEAAPYRAAGEALLRAGKVAALVVAGGQGSRLGIDGPKGAVKVSPVAHKSLFQIHAEKVLALGRRHGAQVPLLVMTSRTNDTATREFFAEHDWFGLNRKDVIFFVQGMLPSITPEGEFIVNRDGGLFLNPDGHGGTLRALRASGALATLKERGIEEIFYFQVDNPLVNICDPLFVGLHHEKGARMSSKVVKKRDVDEKVGVIAMVGGKTQVVEYSDMDDEMRLAVDDGGRMRHWAGSIAIHMIRRDFVEQLTDGTLELPFHRAAKRIAALDAEGKPGEIAGVKFETFIFDALPLAGESVTLEVNREDEFAPVKNARGEDSLMTSQSMQSAQHARWLEAAGVMVTEGTRVEISPLFALDANEVPLRRECLPKSIKTDTYLT